MDAIRLIFLAFLLSIIGMDAFALTPLITCNGAQFLQSTASPPAYSCGTPAGSGNVSTTGSPVLGNLTKFSGATTITNGDMSGDCTTSGTLALTCTKTSGVAFTSAATTAIGTSGATIPLNNGNNTFSGNDIHSGTLAVTGTSTPSQAAGTLGLAGTATAPTLGANSEGDIWLTALDGLNLIGQGSTNDIRVWNKSGTSVCTVATGTTNWNCTGVQVGGVNVLTGNQTITLTGDTTGSGATSIATTTSKVNGGALPTSANVVGTNGSNQIVSATSTNIINLFSTCSGTQYLGADGACHTANAGTVTSFSAGNLSPLFTTSVATATTTPALTFTLTNQNANIVYAGPSSGAAAAPTFRAMVFNDLPSVARQSITAFGRSQQYGSMNIPDQAFFSGQIARTNKVNIFTAKDTFQKDITLNGNIIWFGQTFSGSTGVGSNLVTDNNANVNNFQINSGTAIFNADGLSEQDDNASGHSLLFDINSGLSANHTLTINVNNADRTLTLDANFAAKYANAMATAVAMNSFGGL